MVNHRMFRIRSRPRTLELVLGLWGGAMHIRTTSNLSGAPSKGANQKRRNKNRLAGIFIASSSVRKASTVDGDDFGMMKQAIEDGTGCRDIAEQFSPFFDGSIGGHPGTS
jgi:hypothetical protein